MTALDMVKKYLLMTLFIVSQYYFPYNPTRRFYKKTLSS